MIRILRLVYFQTEIFLNEYFKLSAEHNRFGNKKYL